MYEGSFIFPLLVLAIGLEVKSLMALSGRKSPTFY